VTNSSYWTQRSELLNASDGSKCIAWLRRLSITYKVANIIKVFSINNIKKELEIKKTQMHIPNIHCLKQLSLLKR